jgi:predicted hotdog family 3-hydroxylacyl-ACP dehydratase
VTRTRKASIRVGIVAGVVCAIGIYGPSLATATPAHKAATHKVAPRGLHAAFLAAIRNEREAVFVRDLFRASLHDLSKGK